MIQVEINSEEFKASLGIWQNQFEFAMSKTINDVMKDSQKLVIQKIGDSFTVRRQAFINRSIKISKFAKKDDLTGIIGVENIAGKPTADILAKFEDGGIKRSTSAHVAVPTEFIKPDSSRVMSAGKRPINLSDSFKITDKSGTPLIMQRTGRKKQNLQVAYILKDTVRIDNRLSFVETVGNDIRNNFEAKWQENANKAIDSAIR